MSEVIIKGRRAPRTAPLAFTCGSCGVTLHMRRDACTTSGPCPVCGTVIECCPANETIPDTRTAFNAQDMSVAAPSPAPELVLTPAIAPSIAASPAPADSIPAKGSFQARQRIQQPPSLDDSWKVRCQKDMKKFKKRKHREQMLNGFLNSPTARILKVVVIVGLVVVLVGTMAFVFADRFFVGR